MQVEWAGNQLWDTEVLSVFDSNYINYEQMQMQKMPFPIIK